MKFAQIHWAFKHFNTHTHTHIGLFIIGFRFYNSLINGQMDQSQLNDTNKSSKVDLSLCMLAKSRYAIQFSDIQSGIGYSFIYQNCRHWDYGTCQIHWQYFSSGKISFKMCFCVNVCVDVLDCRLFLTKGTTNGKEKRKKWRITWLSVR